MCSMSSACIEVSRTLAQIWCEIARDPRLNSENSRRGYLHDLGVFEDWWAGRPITKLQQAAVEGHNKPLELVYPGGWRCKDSIETRTSSQSHGAWWGLGCRRWARP